MVIIAVIQAGCTIYRIVRNPSLQSKECLIPNSAWKDYSAANTNYAFEAFETEEKKSMNNALPPVGPRAVLDRKGYGSGAQYVDSRSLQRSNAGYAVPERSTYSLPRTGHASHPPHNGYYTQERKIMRDSAHPEMQPDFYFMPSQRKYSGEVVRVYVDYNK